MKLYLIRYLVLLSILFHLFFSCASAPVDRSEIKDASASITDVSAENTDVPDSEESEVAPAVIIEEPALAAIEPPPVSLEPLPQDPLPREPLRLYPEPEMLLIIPAPQSESDISITTDDSVALESNNEQNADNGDVSDSRPKTDETTDVQITKTPDPAPPVTEKEPSLPVPRPIPLHEINSVDPLPATATLSPPEFKASRSVVLPLGSTLEVWYPGAGWVFLGNDTSAKAVRYESRNQESGGTLFLFKTLVTGNYLLSFTRYDVLSDTFTRDYLEVSVISANKDSNQRVRAPDYNGSITPEQKSIPLKNTETSVLPSATTAFTESPAGVRDEPALSVNSEALQPATESESPSPADLLDAARAAIAELDVKRAIDLLDAFFTVSRDRLDEGWYLRGTAHEVIGPLRDIRKALAAYETVTIAFPESEFWQQSDARIRYIRQFYIQIR